MTICPECQAENGAERYCKSCGASLLHAQPSRGPTAPAVQPAAPTPFDPRPADAAARVCRVCGAALRSDSLFCEECGAALTQPPVPAPLPDPDSLTLPQLELAPVALLTPAATADLAAPMPHAAAADRSERLAPAAAALIVKRSQARLALDAQRPCLVGRTDAEQGIYPDLDLTEHGGEPDGVSRRHARFWVRGQQWFVEDLNSLNGTWLNLKRLPPGEAQPLAHADELRLGALMLVFELTAPVWRSL